MHPVCFMPTNNFLDTWFHTRWPTYISWVVQKTHETFWSMDSILIADYSIAANNLPFLLIFCLTIHEKLTGFLENPKTKSHLLTIHQPRNHLSSVFILSMRSCSRELPSCLSPGGLQYTKHKYYNWQIFSTIPLAYILKVAAKHATYWSPSFRSGMYFDIYMGSFCQEAHNSKRIGYTQKYQCNFISLILEFVCRF